MNANLTHTHDEGQTVAPELARAAVEQHGEQWTELRGQVFEALASFRQPASAYDIADTLSRRLDRRIAPNSVYRILDLFVATNVATRVESRNAYLVNLHPDQVHDCIFLVCSGCGTTTHLDDDRIAKSVRRTAEAAGFRAERPVIEVKGRCSDCA